MKRRQILSAGASAIAMVAGRAAVAADPPGVTATEIKIGNTSPYSGPASTYGVLGKLESAFFGMVNEQGGVGGRKINYISLDDGYSPPKTVEQVRRLVEEEGVAFTFATLGTPTNSAIVKYMNQKKVPHLFLATGADKWGDYKQYPFTIGWQPSYRTEAQIYAKYVLKERPSVNISPGVLYQYDQAAADELGIDLVATGHYVRRVAGSGGAELHRGSDPARDQSYFLFGTTQEQLDYLRFPLGHMPKSETRALAERFGLAVADKPDSQDICFVPGGDYASVVQKLRPDSVEPGDIVDEAGRVLGRHDGIVRFTVGQRRGLALGGRDGTDNDPLYVLRLVPETRRVVVGPRASLGRREIALADVNWLGPDFEGALSAQVRVRSSQTLRPATVRRDGSGGAGWRVVFDEPEFGVSPGQACVIYDAASGSRVLGGGFITRG